MKISKTETGYILKHESGEYFHTSNMSVPTSFLTDDLLTDDPLKAARYLFKPLAEQAIVNAKTFTDVRWDGERILKDVLEHCTPKKITINVDAEVEE
jgi:hypothetical protein